MPQPSRYIRLKSAIVLAGLVVGLYMFFGAAQCHAGEWDISVGTTRDVSSESTVDGDVTDVTKSHSFSLDYSTLLAPTLDFSSSLTFDIDEDIPDSDFRSSNYDTTVTADLTAQWWAFSASWDQGISKTDDPMSSDERTWSYGFEVVVEPEYEKLPQFSYSMDGDQENIDKTLEGSFEYSFLEIVDITVDATRDLGDSRPGSESDSDSRTLSGSVAFNSELTDNLDFEAEWTADRSQELTLTSSGLLLEKTDSLDNSVAASVGYTPLEWIETTLSRDISWGKDLMLPDEPSDRDETMSTEISLTPTITDTLEVSLSHSDERGKTSGSEAEERSWTQSISATLDFAPLDNVSFNSSYDRSYDRSIPSTPGEVVEKTRDDAYDFGLEISLFDDQISYSVTRSMGYAWTQGVETSNDSSWDHSLEIAWDQISNLSFSPAYSMTRDSNYFEGSQTTTRAIEAEISYLIEFGGVSSIDLSHSYSRDADYPDGEANFVSRTDSTSITLGLADFLRGMSTEFSLERAASDESGDDLGPVVDFTHSFSYDWEILEDYSFGFSYDHDMPQESEDSENYSSELSFSTHDGRIQFSFSYEYSVQLEGDKNESSSYAIEVTGEL